MLDIAQTLSEKPSARQQNGGQDHLRDNQPFRWPTYRTLRRPQTACCQRQLRIHLDQAQVPESARKAKWWPAKAKSQTQACGSQVQRACYRMPNAVRNSMNDKPEQRHRKSQYLERLQRGQAERLPSTTGATHGFVWRPVTYGPQFALACLALGDQQTGKVRACNQQDQPHHPI